MIMAQQNTANHPARKMRRVVRETVQTENGVKTLFTCPTCSNNAWRPLDPERTYSYMCDGINVTTVIQMPSANPHTPSSLEIIGLLQELAQGASRPLKQRITGMIRRLETID